MPLIFFLSDIRNSCSICPSIEEEGNARYLASHTHTTGSLPQAAEVQAHNLAGGCFCRARKLTLMGRSDSASSTLSENWPQPLASMSCMLLQRARIHSKEVGVGIARRSRRHFTLGQSLSHRNSCAALQQLPSDSKSRTPCKCDKTCSCKARHVWPYCIS
jgi:hypothetical protein